MLNAIIIALSCVGALGAQVPDQQGLVGYCAATKSSERGCHPGSGKGHWVLNAREAASWPHARAACAAKCAQCSRCAFVSISLLNHDCSWFSQDQCNVDRLETIIHGFQTYEASSPLLVAAAAVVQTDSAARENRKGRSMPWEAQRLPGERRSNCATPCVPSAACAAEVRAWAFDKQTDNGVYFWVQNNGGLKTLTKHLPAVGGCPVNAHDGPLADGPASSAPLTFIDVGAGIYSGTGGHKDFAELDAMPDPNDSDALLLLALFRNRSVVHAFEMNADKVRQLERAVRIRPATQRFAERLHVHQMGVGNTSAQGRVVKCGGGRGYANTWRAMEASQAPPSADCDIGDTFRLTTMDDFVARNLIPSIMYAKVDVEGGELDVLSGMEGLLRAQRVETMSFEYALGWHPAFAGSGAVPLAKRASIQQTLFRFQQRLSALGYDTYLIHARPSKEAGASRGVHARDVTLVPVYGNFWHDDYEICFDRKVAYGRYKEWCWNDLFVVRRCNKCVKRTMLKALQGGRQLFPSCDCL